MKDKIMGGYVILARQIFDSKIWLDKPSTWKIIWIYIFGQVNHKDNSQFKRGEGFFNFKREIKNIGCDITYDMIRHSLRFFKDNEMISTSRSTRGISIKVLKFDKYQDPNNYTSTNTSTSKAQEKHIKSTPINKNERMKECKNNMQAEPAEWNYNNYIENLLNDKRRHINIIGKYFKATGKIFPSLKAGQAELKRWLKDASVLAEYTDEQITNSYNYVKKEFPNVFNLATIRKYINN